MKKINNLWCGYVQLEVKKMKMIEEREREWMREKMKGWIDNYL